MRSVYLLFLVAFLIIPKTSVGAEITPFVVANIASKHYNSATRSNETNTGLSFGASSAFGETAEIAADAGFYKNSYSKTSGYVAVTLTQEVFQITPGISLRGGMFFAVADYGPDAVRIKPQGFPRFGDFIVFAGAAAVIRQDNGYEVILRVAPARPVADAIFVLQVARRF